MASPPVGRHLLRAKDLADARYAEPLIVDDLASVAGYSRGHFSQEFKRAFGESSHAYLLTRRLERAAALLRTTAYCVADICIMVGLQSVGSFTTGFVRMHGRSLTAYRAAFPPASQLAIVPSFRQPVPTDPGAGLLVVGRQSPRSARIPHSPRVSPVDAA